MTQSEIENAYNELIKPTNFIQLFKTSEEFIEWCRLGTSQDLTATLYEFEKYELYEYCSIIKKILFEKL